MQLRFEWDEGKAGANLRKHGVRFEEAQTVFYDPLACIFDDEWHSTDEPREIIIGHSNASSLLLVCFTEREPGLIRMISARRVTKRERRDYEKTEMDENELVEQNEDMLPEYHFDYSKARSNRFAEGIAEGSLVVVLEPELAQVFKTPEHVKAILEAIAQAMPPQ